jgi:hypothetical protein
MHCERGYKKYIKGHFFIFHPAVIAGKVFLPTGIIIILF